MLHEAVCAAVEMAVCEFVVAASGGDWSTEAGVEENLGHFDECEVKHRHCYEDGEESERKTAEPESGCERGKRNQCTDAGGRDWRAQHQDSRTTAKERCPTRSNDKHNERLGRETLDEPSAAEFGVSGVEDDEHDKESREVEE